MAGVSGFSELTRFDDRVRLLGLNNNMFNTNDLVEAELTILDLQAQPKRTQQTVLTEEKAVWENFLSEFKTLTKSFSDLRFYETGKKEVSYSKEGVTSVVASPTAQKGEYTIRVDRLAEKHQVAGADMGGSDNALGITDTVKINGVDLSITSTMTLRDVVNTVNNGDYGASATIVSNRLVLTAKDSGIANKMTLTDGVNKGFRDLGVLTNTGAIINETKAAQDSQFVVNGITQTRATNAVTDVVEGLTINLNSVSTDVIQVKVESDSKSAVEAVENMVNTYNSAILKYKEFTGKGTYLQGQSIPLGVRMDMTQMSSFSSVEGNYLFEYGVEVDGVAKDGTLTLDKTKLEEMYNDNPEEFQNMFFGENGLGKHMETKLYRYTGETGSIKGKIDGLNKSLETVNDSLEQFEIYYENQKNTILNKYAQFETIMAGLNSQLQYMESQMAALNNSNNK